MSFWARTMARASIESGQQGQLVRFEEATYWLHHEYLAA